MEQDGKVEQPKNVNKGKLTKWHQHFKTPAQEHKQRFKGTFEFEFLSLNSNLFRFVDVHNIFPHELFVFVAISQ